MAIVSSWTHEPHQSFLQLGARLRRASLRERRAEESEESLALGIGKRIADVISGELVDGTERRHIEICGVSRCRSMAGAVAQDEVVHIDTVFLVAQEVIEVRY
jgi:hypothetical protein